MNEWDECWNGFCSLKKCVGGQRDTQSNSIDTIVRSLVTIYSYLHIARYIRHPVPLPSCTSDNMGTIYSRYLRCFFYARISLLVLSIFWYCLILTQFVLIFSLKLAKWYCRLGSWITRWRVNLKRFRHDKKKFAKPCIVGLVFVSYSVHCCQIFKVNMPCAYCSLVKDYSLPITWICTKTISATGKIILSGLLKHRM